MDNNVLTVESTGVPWRPTAPRYFLDQAIGRALTRREATMHEEQTGENRD